MSKSLNQKAKLFYLLEIFKKETDDSHGLTTDELIRKMNSKGIKVERKTMGEDIRLLSDLGYDILSERRGRQFYYYMGNREFELAEIKMLVDLIQSSKFITDKKSKSLISKIGNLTSKYEKKQLDRQVFITGRLKTQNEQIYYNVDRLHSAISSNVIVTFYYLQWDMDKKQIKKYDGKVYKVSPWGLTWNNEKYYLLAHDEESKEIRHYRVDKMENIELTDEGRNGEEKYSRIDPALYTKQVFGMYGGELTKVRFEVKNSCIGIILDRFGPDIDIEKKSDTFEFEADVAISDQFFGWILSIGNGVRIIGPDRVVDEIKAMIEERRKLYK